jgi:tetratricopeptide (TPR) repeat protein
MSRLKRLIIEAHRRSLWQVFLIYCGGALVAYQAVQALTEGLGLPDWFPGFAVGLFIIFLPVVLATAFVQEGIAGPGAREPVVAPTDAGDPAEPEEPAAIRERGAHHRILTWRNAILALAGAFAVLGVGVSGYTAMRVMGIGPAGTLIAKGVLESRDPIVIADFESATGDTLLAMAVTEALRTDLSQSPVVRVVEPEQLHRVLQRMRRETEAAIDYQLAREVAIRDGLKAIVAGEINSVGTGYVLTVRLVAVETGEVLVAYREAATDSARIISVIDQASKGLRERIGESLKTIRQAEPLERVTTSSLAALQKYSLALRVSETEGDEARGITLFEEAIALDTTFAMAYRALGIGLGNMFQERARQVEAFTKAYQYRDRLTERERYLTLADYYTTVAGDRERAINAYLSLLDLYPDDPTALNNLGNLYSRQRDYARAAELYLRGVDVDSSNPVAYFNAVATHVDLGRPDEAGAILRAMEQRFPLHPMVALSEAGLSSAAGDYESAAERMKESREVHSGSLALRAEASTWLARFAAVRGRLGEARAYLRDAMTANEDRGLPAECLKNTAEMARWDVEIVAEPARALRSIEESLRRYALESIPPLDRPYGELAWLYARAGRSDLARPLLDEYEAVIEPGLRRSDEPLYSLVLGDLALAEGRLQEAIAEHRVWAEEAPVWCRACGDAQLGFAYELSDQPDSALVLYEGYLTTPWMWRVIWDSYYLATIYERLGLLHERRGNRQRAIYYYGKLVELWQDADAELQPRVEAARRAIEALSPDT